MSHEHHDGYPDHSDRTCVRRAHNSDCYDDKRYVIIGIEQYEHTSEGRGMTKKDLKRYMSLKCEEREVTEWIRRLETDLAKLEGTQESDVVACGRRGKKALGTVKITGFPDRKYQDRRTKLISSQLRHKTLLEKIEEQTEAVEEYICAIEDSEVRRILRFRVMGTRAMSWQEVANHMNRYGGCYTADSCRMIVSRFLRS